MHPSTVRSIEMQMSHSYLLLLVDLGHVRRQVPDLPPCTKRLI